MTHGQVCSACDCEPSKKLTLTLHFELGSQGNCNLHYISSSSATHVYILYHDDSSEKQAREVFTNVSWVRFQFLEATRGRFFESMTYITELEVCKRIASLLLFVAVKQNF
jgi:hypothetical protein